MSEGLLIPWDSPIHDASSATSMTSHEDPGTVDVTWSRSAADQIRFSDRWKLRDAP